MLKAIDALVLTLSETGGVTPEPPRPSPYVPLQEVYTHWHPVFQQTPHDADIFSQECFTGMHEYVQKLLARETELREDDETKDTAAPMPLSLEQTTFGLPSGVIANLQVKDLLPWQSELLLKTVPLETQKDEYVPRVTATSSYQRQRRLEKAWWHSSIFYDVYLCARSLPSLLFPLLHWLMSLLGN